MRLFLQQDCKSIEDRLCLPYGSLCSWRGLRWRRAQTRLSLNVCRLINGHKSSLKWTEEPLILTAAPFLGGRTPCPSLTTVREEELESCRVITCIRHVLPACGFHTWFLQHQGCIWKQLHPFQEVQGNLDRHLFFLPELGTRRQAEENQNIT